MSCHEAIYDEYRHLKPKKKSMLDKAKRMCELIDEMDKSGYYFSGKLEKDFDRVYAEIAFEYQFPPEVVEIERLAKELEEREKQNDVR